MNSSESIMEQPVALRRPAARTFFRSRRRYRQGVLVPYLYLLPALLTVGIWVYKPLIQLFGLSFFQWNLLPTSPKVPVGLGNYRQLLSLPEFGAAIRNTVLYIVGILPMSILIPVIIALQTNRLSEKIRKAYRAVIFLPFIMAPVVITVLWRWLLNPYGGFVNDFILEPLLHHPVSFFGESCALYTIIFITGWSIVGFSTLIFSSAIVGIDRSYLESATLEGATYGQMSRRIILPLLSPQILLMTMLTVLLASQWTFVHVNVITQYSSYMHVTNIYHLLYIYGFRSFNIGWSSAAAVLMFIVFGLIAVFFLRLTEKYSFYDN